MLSYTCVLFLFIIGFMATGTPNYAMLYNRLLNENNAPQEIPPVSRWGLFKRRTAMLFPFIWPKSKYLIQLRIVICVLILIITRVINLYVPIFYKNVVNSLTPNITANHTISDVVHQMKYGYFNYIYVTLVGENGLVYRWDLILYYIGIRAVQGVGSPSSGILGSLQSQLWLTVDLFCSRKLGVYLFRHLHR